MNKISLIIPTYKRIIDFQRTLISVYKQINDIDEVIIVIGPNDIESFNLAIQYKGLNDNFKVIQIQKASVVNALNCGLLKSTKDIICLTDDDIVLPEGWAKRIKEGFLNDPKMGAFGGPDKLTDKNLDSKYGYNPVKEVGVFKWNTMVGNHHLGIIKSPSEVDVLKGVNLSFKREALKSMCIDSFLEFKGAEQCWEIDLAQRIQANGFKIIYDNDNFLYHFISQRESYDKRGDIFSELNYNKTLNINYVYAKFRPLYEIFFLIFKQFFIGSKIQPGIIRAFFMIKKNGLKVVYLPFKNCIPIYLGLFGGFKKRFKKK
ncbi:glycosyltransferase [Flavobacterium franklandianum]|uniref:Glycosyltransferase family 2 protein n=1 Tax=Flavobacterium franklandianum TaxID=2594430 RepID=A0A553CR32_9FLAO|nr:glycosyltransferase family 2 protein [Flavobacterium franklandianum]TRX22998.1 glycosyltransferase family 2 protein [Flavobacterium franklandianum]